MKLSREGEEYSCALTFVDRVLRSKMGLTEDEVNKVMLPNGKLDPDLSVLWKKVKQDWLEAYAEVCESKDDEKKRFQEWKERNPR